MSLSLGPLDLLVLQPTPFCNIDCSYCYLPSRQSTERMSLTVLRRTFERVFESGLAAGRFTVIWHAGEPLVLPPAFYQEAFAILDECNNQKIPIDHSFQTNGTLLNDEWCRFIKANPVRIGVSVDGPAFLHDRFRKTRQGQGTWQRVVDGMRLLRQQEIPFHVISVLTHDALDYPDEIFDFFRRERVTRVGFNVEEIEGPHRQSTLAGDFAVDRYKRFMSRFFDLARRTPPIQVREFVGALSSILRGHPGCHEDSHELRPGAILSVDCAGNFCTFSPELLGLPSADYGDFSLGNVLEDGFASMTNSAKFRRIYEDIERGVAMCRETCEYFDYCSGGAPVNKYFENGTFASTETLFCRLNRQALLDVAIDKVAALPPAV